MTYDGESPHARLMLTTVGSGQTVSLGAEHLLRRAAVDPEVKEGLTQLADPVEDTF